MKKLILLRAAWPKHLVYSHLILVFHSLFPLLSSFLRWVEVEKVSGICAWYITILCTTLCSVSLKLPLFARISHVVTGEKTRMFFLIPLLLQIAVGKEGKRQVGCHELVACFKRELISTFKSTQYWIIQFIYTWNALQQLVITGIPESGGNIGGKRVWKKEFLTLSVLLQTWAGKDSLQISQRTPLWR